MTEPSKVIHVRNVGHEISEPDLPQLFQPFGVINKLVMLRAKNQALLQMQDVPSAVSAMQFYANVQPSIRGRNVYVQFSSHQELTTMEQNTQGRWMRFVLFNRYSFKFAVTEHRCLLKKHSTFLSGFFFNKLLQVNIVSIVIKSEGGACLGAISECSEGLAPGLDIHRLVLVVPCKQGVILSDIFMNNAAAIAAAFGGGLPPGISGTNDRCTILASNLNPDRIDEDKLFNLFSLYGNIVRIKLLRNKPDHALVQMGDGFQAELAVHFLKGATLFGKRLEVNYSKHPNITMGAETHEYLNSNLNRFNRNAAKNYRYCCSPTKMIHLSSLPQDVTEEEIISHLEEHGSIVNTKVFEMNGKKQALVMFENEEQATEALVCKHVTTLADSIIRISFSQLQTI
ncbi:polypyrimidine tract-binding protein homolog 3-like [Bidens hawaiensis]|uniref:polypyrimidine tract-binding protein homolog 3-like n=1 Tax=Bidens hawaiensis TaxID=980011 RepID=UPI00404A41DD